MKYVVIIPSGGADKPLEELDGLTPLEAAQTPHMDSLAKAGRVGTVATTPKGSRAASDVCVLNLMGYQPAEFYPGHGVLLARGAGFHELETDDFLSLSLVTAGDLGSDQRGILLDHQAGSIPDAESRELLQSLAAYWAVTEPSIWAGYTLLHASGSEAFLVDRSTRAYGCVESVSPQDVLDRPWVQALASGGVGGEGAMLGRLIRSSHEFLSRHEINLARIEQGLRPANLAWIWGMGRPARLPSLSSRNQVKAAMLCSDTDIGGLAESIGMEVISVPRPSGDDESAYQRTGQAIINTLPAHDLICCHVSMPRLFSHQGNHPRKIRSIEAIDRFVIGPVSDALKAYGDMDQDAAAEGWRMMVVADHAALCGTRVNDSMDVPFMISGGRVQTVVPRVFSEREAMASDLHIGQGSELMEYFLRSGLSRADTK